MGGRARPEWPGEAVLSLSCEAHIVYPKAVACLGHRRDLVCTVLRCIHVEAWWPALSIWSSLCNKFGGRDVFSVLIRRAFRWLLLGTARMFTVFRQVHR